MWDVECDEAFWKLKEICISTLILAYDDLWKQFKLHTDVCTLGLVAIPYQNQDGDDRVIGYASRPFSKTECRFLAHKLEFLALKWATMDQCHQYL